MSFVTWSDLINTVASARCSGAKLEKGKPFERFWFGAEKPLETVQRIASHQHHRAEAAVLMRSLREMRGAF